MSNPIDRLLDTGVHRLAERRSAEVTRNSKDGTTEPRAEHTSDLLDLTGRARQLQALEHELARSQEFDAERVDALRQSIADGSYQVNAKRIAEKLLTLDGELP